MSRKQTVVAICEMCLKEKECETRIGAHILCEECFEGPRDLNTIRDDVKRSLNPSGAGYRIAEASDHMTAAAAIGCGIITRPFARLARAGAAVALKAGRYQPVTLDDGMATIEDVAKASQGDFNDYCDGFDWIYDESSLDETPAALRKTNGKLNYTEAMQLLALLEKKGSQLQAVIGRWRVVFANNPQWRLTPHLELFTVLGMSPNKEPR